LWQSARLLRQSSLNALAVVSATRASPKAGSLFDADPAACSSSTLRQRSKTYGCGGAPLLARNGRGGAGRDRGCRRRRGPSRRTASAEPPASATPPVRRRRANSVAERCARRVVVYRGGRDAHGSSQATRGCLGYARVSKIAACIASCAGSAGGWRQGLWSDDRRWCWRQSGSTPTPRRCSARVNTQSPYDTCTFLRDAGMLVARAVPVSSWQPSACFC